MLTLEVPAADGNGAAQTFRGGWATVEFTGTFDNGSPTLRASYDGRPYVDVLDELGSVIAPTADAHLNFHKAGPVDLRITLSGSSSATAVVCKLHEGWAATRDREH